MCGIMIPLRWRSLKFMPKRGSDADHRIFFDQLVSVGVRVSGPRARSGLRTGMPSWLSVTKQNSSASLIPCSRTAAHGPILSARSAAEGPKGFGSSTMHHAVGSVLKSRRALPRGLRLRPDRASERARSPRRQTAGHARRRPDALQTCAAKLGRPTPRQTQPPYRSVGASPYRHSPRPNCIPTAAKQRAGWAIAAPARYKPRAAAIEAIPNLKLLWRAKSTEDLEVALDTAQSAILEALQSNDPQTRLNAASLMLRSRQARERGWS